MIVQVDYHCIVIIAQGIELEREGASSKFKKSIVVFSNHWHSLTSYIDDDNYCGPH